MIYAFTAIFVITQILVPRRFALFPIIFAVFLTTQAQVLPNLTILRILLLVQLFKLTLRSNLDYRLQGRIDKYLLILSIIILVSAIGHSFEYGNPYYYRLRVAFDLLAVYLISKSTITSKGDFIFFCKTCAFAVIPLGLGLIFERLSGSNVFNLIGAPDTALLRNDILRARGPFGTPILAGTSIALVTPALVFIKNLHSKLSYSSMAVGGLGIYSTGSSTPIASLLLAVLAMLLWNCRKYTKQVILGAIFAIMFLQLFRERPVWYLMALPDFVGGSTGWHRAYLIDTAITHFSEWWLWGTDYTRHWMPYGLSAIPQHCDLTNYYIHIGVTAGFGATLLLVLIIFSAFKSIYQTFHSSLYLDTSSQFLIWITGTMLFTHTITFLTISYFDQTYALFMITLGACSKITTPSFLNQDS